MQKLLKSIKAHCLVLSAILLNSCASIPVRPVGDVCAIDVSKNYCVCVNSSTGAPSNSGDLFMCNKFIALSPDFYFQLENWTQELIQRVRGFPRQKKMAQDEIKTFTNAVKSSQNFIK